MPGEQHTIPLECGFIQSAATFQVGLLLYSAARVAPAVVVRNLLQNNSQVRSQPF